MNERRELIEFLKSDLYTRVCDVGQDGMLWESPLKWGVIIRGPRESPDVQIVDPSGQLYATLRNTNSSELDSVLP